MRRVVIGLGSNLGDRRANVEAGLRALRAIPAFSVTATSSLWQTAPVGGPPQADYCNAAALAMTDLDARTVLEALLAIEKKMGRTRGRERDAPRTLDLDLLWIDGEIVAQDEVFVPHPRLRSRPFALVPLLEVAPDATDPSSREPYARILDRLGLDGVRRWPNDLD